MKTKQKLKNSTNLKNYGNYFVGGLLGGGEGGGSSSSSYATWNPKLDPHVDNILERAETLSNNPYQAYTGDRIAGFSDDQLNAQQGVRDVQGQYGDVFGQSIGQYDDLYNMSLNNSSLDMSGIDKFINPYTQNVIDTTKREMVDDYQRTINGLGDQAVNMGSFGSDRHGIVEGMATENLHQGLSDVQYSGMQDAYNNAQNMLLQDAGLMNNSISLAGNLTGQNINAAGQGQAYDYRDLSMLDTSGAQQQGLEQAQFDVNYSDFLEQREDPYNKLQFYNNIVSPLAVSSMGQENETQANGGGDSTLGNIAGIASAAAGFFKEGGMIPKNYASGGRVTNGQKDSDGGGALENALKVQPMQGVPMQYTGVTSTSSGGEGGGMDFASFASDIGKIFGEGGIGSFGGTQADADAAAKAEGITWNQGKEGSSAGWIGNPISADDSENGLVPDSSGDWLKTAGNAALMFFGAPPLFAEGGMIPKDFGNYAGGGLLDKYMEGTAEGFKNNDFVDFVTGIGAKAVQGMGDLVADPSVIDPRQDWDAKIEPGMSPVERLTRNVMEVPEQIGRTIGGIPAMGLEAVKTGVDMGGSLLAPSYTQSEVLDKSRTPAEMVALADTPAKKEALERTLDALNKRANREQSARDKASPVNKPEVMTKQEAQKQTARDQLPEVVKKILPKAPIQAAGPELSRDQIMNLMMAKQGVLPSKNKQPTEEKGLIKNEALFNLGIAMLSQQGSLSQKLGAGGAAYSQTKNAAAKAKQDRDEKIRKEQYERMKDQQEHDLEKRKVDITQQKADAYGRGIDARSRNSGSKDKSKEALQKQAREYAEENSFGDLNEAKRLYDEYLFQFSDSPAPFALSDFDT